MLTLTRFEPLNYEAGEVRTTLTTVYLLTVEVTVTVVTINITLVLMYFTPVRELLLLEDVVTFLLLMLLLF